MELRWGWAAGTLASPLRKEDTLEDVVTYL